MRQIALAALMLALLVGAAACGGDAGAGDPAETVEQYLQAKVESDRDTLSSLLCAEMEGALEREVRTFDSVSGARLDGMSCTQDGESNTVRCTGRILATYGTEETEFPLVAYRVVQEDGEWKWCGETN